MKKLQRWFEVLAGVTREEQNRVAFARMIYGASADLSPLAVPACWRRQRRVRIAGY